MAIIWNTTNGVSSLVIGPFRVSIYKSITGMFFPFMNGAALEIQPTFGEAEKLLLDRLNAEVSKASTDLIAAMAVKN